MLLGEQLLQTNWKGQNALKTNKKGSATYIPWIALNLINPNPPLFLDKNEREDKEESTN